MTRQTRHLTQDQVWEMLASNETNTHFKKKFKVSIDVIGRARTGASYTDYYESYVATYGEPVKPRNNSCRRRLSETEVISIYRDERLPLRLIAADYQCSTDTVEGIKNGRNHRAITDRIIRLDNMKSQADEAPDNADQQLVRVTFMCEGRKEVYQIPRHELAEKHRSAA